MQRIPCACTVSVERLSNPWLININKAYNHVMISNPKHVGTLQYYVAIINGIFPNLILKKKQHN